MTAYYVAFYLLAGFIIGTITACVWLDDWGCPWSK